MRGLRSRLALAGVLLCALLAGASSAQFGTRYAIDGVSLEDIAQVLPGADRAAPSKANTPARAVWRGEELLGYAYLSDEIHPVPAFSGRPIRTLVGLGLDARIRGVRILQHEEPILVIGVTDEDLHRYIAQFHDRLATDKVRIGAYQREGYVGIDGITGATITAMVLNSSVMDTARIVAEALRLPDAARAHGERAEDSHPEHAESPQPAPAAIDATSSGHEPMWRGQWQARRVEMAVLIAALLLLTAVLFFQDALVRRARLFHGFRVAFLVFTVLFIGCYCLAQLSVVNFLAFLRVLFGGFTWESLLIDPLIFLLWGFVAVSILLWGRGVYCGWLCPFGAAQDLIGKLAEWLRVPQIRIPATVHERLWAIKYLLLLALVGLSLDSMPVAARLAEVEPFKTTFVLRFQREWWFVAYALALLAIAFVQSKFFCKYLCPLGAGLSLFARFRIFDWLRRRHECGKPCNTCAAQCQIGAIAPSGVIVDHECHYCLECQVTYWDEHRCPPLIERRKRREQREHNAAQMIARSRAD